MMKPEKVKSRWRKSCEAEMMNEQLNSAESDIPTYVALEENLYLFEKKRTKNKKEVRRMLCDCRLSKEDIEKGVPGCQDKCLNRLLMIECGSRCATGDACSNKRFQKRLYPKVMPFKTEKKGWGLKLLEDVPTGNFVIEYVGEVLNREDFQQRVTQYAREKKDHYYFMSLKTDEIIDASMKGNLSRFMNHSCEPNCETQKWTVNGELRIGFFAKRDLKSGEELTFDYQLQRYGRKAQKCHCSSKLCSGSIGVSQPIPVEVTTKPSTKHRKRSSDEKKKEEIEEDLILEQEIKKLSENGGLKNKDETLTLARLMVRAEDDCSRDKLLDVILGTSEKGCFKWFLNYHGLSLLWSWMVDRNDSKLKLKILKVLYLLPVPNKKLLLESKILTVVEKWAHGTEHNSPNCEVNKNGFKKTSTSDDSPNLMKNETSFSDEEQSDHSLVSDESNGEISSLAKDLLSYWQEIKEVFRIPRREHQKPGSKDNNFNKKFDKFNNRNRHIKESDYSKDKQKDFSTHQERNSEQRPRKVLLPTPVILTKEERRQQFERAVMEKDELARRALQNPIHDGSAINAQYSTNSNVYYASNNGIYQSSNVENYPYTIPDTANHLSQYYVNPNEYPGPGLLAIANHAPDLNQATIPMANNPTSVYPPNTVYHSPHTAVPMVVQSPLMYSQPTQQYENIPLMLGTVGNVTSSPAVPTIPNTSTEYPVNPLYPDQTSSCITNQNLIPSPSGSHYPSGQEQFCANQSGHYYPQALCSTLTEQVTLSQITYSSAVTNSCPQLEVNLPPDWKTATDQDGNIYYYNIHSRETRWDPPEFGVESSDDATPTYDEPKPKKKSPIPTSTRAPADTSSSYKNPEVAKKIKELFRTKMSSFVVQCLNPYHQKHCRVGRIASSDDFKHLARKLTFFIMSKELKHCKNVEDLDCNESVKCKARDFINKYMTKFGALYQRDKCDSPSIS